MPDQLGKVAILWRGNREERNKPIPKNSRLFPIFESLTALGMVVEPVIYADEFAEEVREQLVNLDAVLVWVDPIRGDDSRTKLDALLRDVAAQGVYVSAHPDVILKMGTKEVLYRTRELGWGSDTHLYTSFPQFNEQFPSRLSEGRARVIKQNRGNGGIGVWRVEIVANVSTGRSAPNSTNDPTVRVQHAAPRNDDTEEMSLSSFMGRCERYFADSGRLIDQAFADRLGDGLIRAYIVSEKVVGFARQYSTVQRATNSTGPALDKVFGIPSPKTMFGPLEPEFQPLKLQLESEWIPGLDRLVGVDAQSLPLLWDADFLYGPKTTKGEDTYVLCEINVSSVSPFPDMVPNRLSDAVLYQMQLRRGIGVVDNLYPVDEFAQKDPD